MGNVSRKEKRKRGRGESADQCSTIEGKEEAIVQWQLVGESVEDVQEA